MTSASTYGVLYNTGGTAADNGGTDGAITASEPFTVPSGSVLVVQFSEYATSNSGTDANPTIKWTPSGGTASRSATPIISQVGGGPGYPYADIFYLTNLTAGAGTISVSAAGRSASIGARAFRREYRHCSPCRVERLELNNQFHDL